MKQKTIDFVGYLAIFLLIMCFFIKAINEFSKDSINFTNSANNFLFLAIICGAGYYLLLFLDKEQKDLFQSKMFQIDLSLKSRLMVSLIGGIFIGVLASIKTQYWIMGIVPTICFSVFAFFLLFFSLAGRSSQSDKK